MGNVFAFDPQSWATLRRLLDAALALDPGARRDWLAALGPEHAALKPRLSALLSHAEDGAELRLHTLPQVDAAGPALPPDHAGVAPGQGVGGKVGPYRLLRLLGEGGMGSVWLAERGDMLQRRQVALKLPRGAGHRPGLVERMAREREILAALDHPNIARLYDAGADDHGQPYLALEYVEGERIDSYCIRHRLDLDARLRLFVQVVRAVAHAHAQLVVHRDLKPANILVTQQAQVRLLDFGVAKLLGDASQADTSLTELTGRAMTLDYAAPEQVLGGVVGTAADIYSLGVVLHELLAGQRPYKLDAAALGRSAAIEQAILRAELSRPSAVVADRALCRALRGDLDTIVLKALKKEPQQRYRTADALAEDIERHLAHEPVWARPDSRWYRTRKFVARHRLAVGAAASVALAVVGGAGAALWQAELARAEQRRAQEVKDFVVSIFHAADLYRGSGQPLTAVDLLQQARRKVDRSLAGSPEARLEMLTLIGFSLYNLQEDVNGAEALMRQAVAEGTAALGPRHLQVLRARETHALTLRYAGTAAQQQQALAALIPDLRARGDALMPELVRAIEGRVVLALTEGRYAEAEKDAREMLSLATTKLGADHEQTLDATLVLASALHHQKRSQEALALAREFYPRVLARHGGNARTPAVIEAGMLYGRVLAQAGELDAGIRLLEQVLADARVVFGPLSVGVGFIASNLARWQADAGQIKPALASIEVSLAAMEKAPGPGSIPYAKVLDQRAAVLLTARRPSEAAQAFDRLVQALESLRGPTHESVHAARLGRIEALLMAGEAGRARSELDDLVARFATVKEIAPDAELPVRGILLRLAGDAQGALLLHEQALQTLPATPQNASRHAALLYQVGLDLLLRREAERAASVLERALELASRPPGTQTPDRAEIGVALGRARLDRDDAAGALAPLQQADAYWRDFDPGSRWAGEAALWLARAQAVLGQTLEARANEERATRLLAASPPAAAAALPTAGRRR